MCGCSFSYLSEFANGVLVGISVALCIYALKIIKVAMAPEYLRRYPGLCIKHLGVSKQLAAFVQAGVVPCRVLI